MSNDPRTPPPPPRRQRYASLVTQLGEAKSALDEAKAAYEALADRARTELPLGRHAEGDVEVLITRNRTWDKAKGLEVFGTRICSPAVDLKLARFVLTGEEFESFYIEEAPKVLVRQRDDDERPS